MPKDDDKTSAREGILAIAGIILFIAAMAPVVKGLVWLYGWAL